MDTIKRTNSDNVDFKTLVGLLNKDLADRDGANHPLAKFNPIQNIKGVIVVYSDEVALGCGAFSPLDNSTMEVKRMYVSSESRGKGMATKILNELEQWGRELGFSKALLFMGSNQPEATRLYTNSGYVQIPSYGNLSMIEDCNCYCKDLL
ncbi:MAG: putative acetyltransferase [Saprospiraceae bacterium]|jgi:putative acetyltransferase